MWPDDDEVEAEAEAVCPVLTPSSLSPWLIAATLVQGAAATAVLWGNIAHSFGNMLAQHWESREERRALSAAVATTIETITEG